MSQYTRFEVTNFKGIKHIVIDLLPGKTNKVFTLVGLNESGKTTVLEAIDLFQKDIPVETRHAVIPKSKKTNFNDKISVAATVDLDAEDEKRIANFAKTKGFTITQPIGKFTNTKSYLFKNSRFEKPANTVSIKIIGSKGKSKAVKQILSPSDEWNSIVNFILENILPPIVYYPNFLFNFPQKIYLNEVADDKEEQKFYRQVIQDILDSIGDDLNIEDHLLNRLSSTGTEDRESLEAVINKMGVIVTQKIFRTWDNIFRSNIKSKTAKAKQREIKITTGKDTDTAQRYFLEG
ncbi:MAG: AAA family ATPase [Patescibacteria group bacterium]|jgi:AAA15 family ATPase/GTPase